MCAPYAPVPALFRALDAYEHDDLSRPGAVVLHPLAYFDPPPRRPGKCEACGSRDFVLHHNELICTYCRSEA